MKVWYTITVNAKHRTQEQPNGQHHRPRPELGLTATVHLQGEPNRSPFLMCACVRGQARARLAYVLANACWGVNRW